jgi:hypothetical protein
MNCDFSITYKSIDARDGQPYWINEDVPSLTIMDNGFVYIVDKNDKEFMLPTHMIGRIDKHF